MMKPQTSPLCKQGGATLLESLVGLILFSIIILGSGMATSRMLHSQKEMNVDFVILNLMQNKLQNALATGASGGICERINTDDFHLASQTYHVRCGVEHIELDGLTTEWPILAASKDAALAASCAAGSVHINCYIVGR